jgi:hypothetical protein
VIVQSLSLEVSGREDVVMDLSTPEAVQRLKESKSPLCIKEGIDYRLKIKFRVQHDVVAGLKYLQAVKRLGVVSAYRCFFAFFLFFSFKVRLECLGRNADNLFFLFAGLAVDKTEAMLGSYGPRAEVYEKKFEQETAPSGMMARGKYDVRSRFVDDDKNVHLEWNWTFEIAKDWN